MRIAALYVIYNEEDYIQQSLGSVYEVVDEIVICLTERRPWFGPSRRPDRTLDIIKSFNDIDKKITLRTGDWSSEQKQRQAALEIVKNRCTHGLIIDGDEVYKHSHVQNLKNIAAAHPEMGQLALGMNTYWKSPLWRIDPPEPYTPIVITKITGSTTFTDLRATNETPVRLVDRSIAILHHFSYAKPSNKIRKKIENFSHANEIVSGWFEKMWLAWDSDPSMENLHPTHPICYKRAVFEDKKNLPEVMWEHPLVLSTMYNSEYGKQ